ncbi:hypothetical protein Ato02nite_060790 [Paractinoplanes toevensis]|uniref:Uncharacterized protein n=1 Tax=Paractinoplanes toevensis TaxID=571911 RepID=A0A919TI09_9ACTN|nr:hypothetical protein Ato02nite_060790 [Actinoplanes toevensis]
MVRVTVGPPGFAQSAGTFISPHWTFSFSGHGCHTMTGGGGMASAGLTPYASSVVTVMIAARKGRAEARTACLSALPGCPTARPHLETDHEHGAGKRVKFAGAWHG